MLQVRAPQQQGGPWTKGRERSGPVLGCKQFQSQNFSWPQDMQSIAVVGNGPLTEQSRQEINVSYQLDSWPPLLPSHTVDSRAEASRQFGSRG